VIPPKEWVPRRNGYDDIDIVIPIPIEQAVYGQRGAFQLFNLKRKEMTVKQFEKLANDPK